MQTITWNDFEMVELRVGTIVEVLDFPEAKKPAYKILAVNWDKIRRRVWETAQK